jgi:hypothetical protein
MLKLVARYFESVSDKTESANLSLVSPIWQHGRLTVHNEVWQ